MTRRETPSWVEILSARARAAQKRPRGSLSVPPPPPGQRARHDLLVRRGARSNPPPLPAAPKPPPLPLQKVLLKRFTAQPIAARFDDCEATQNVEPLDLREVRRSLAAVRAEVAPPSTVKSAGRALTLSVAVSIIVLGVLIVHPAEDARLAMRLGFEVLTQMRPYADMAAQAARGLAARVQEEARTLCGAGN